MMKENSSNEHPEHGAGRARQPLDFKADFRNEVEPALAALEGAMDVLPAVDKNGQSDCPFASQLYRAKDKEAERLGSHLNRVHAFLSRAEEEVARCEARLEFIRKNADDLNDPRTRAEFDGAISAARKDLVNATHDKKAIKDMLTRMERALSYASRISYGQMQPGPWDPPDTAATKSHPAGGSSPHHSGTGAMPSAHGGGTPFSGPWLSL